MGFLRKYSSLKHIAPVEAAHYPGTPVSQDPLFQYSNIPTFQLLDPEDFGRGGKSTLLKLLAGKMLPDSGDIRRRQGLRVAALEQDVPAGFDGTVFDAVAEGLGQTGRSPAGHNRITNGPQVSENSRAAEMHDELQHMPAVGES